MASWFSRRRSLAELPRLRPRDASSTATRLDLSEFTPAPTAYLGQVACLQLEFFQSFSRASTQALDFTVKESIAQAAALAIDKHQSLLGELRRLGEDPTAAMEPFSPAIQRFQQATIGADWQENLLGAYLTSGLLGDFFIRLARGLPRDLGERVIEVLAAESGYEPIVVLLQKGIASDPALSSRLALWGRRLVGDTLLLARSALLAPEDVRSGRQEIEPVFTDLMSAHARRMDALGLTA